MEDGSHSRLIEIKGHALAPSTLVKNTGQTLEASGTELETNRTHIGQAFTTSSQSRGYNLSEIGIWFQSITDTATAGSELTVTLNADNSGDPGAVICTLDDPASFSASGLHTFTAPSGGCQTLAPATDYFVVIERENNDTGTISLSQTEDYVEDTLDPATGWTIGNRKHHYFVHNTSWNDFDGPHIIEVQGTACVAPAGPFGRDACNDFNSLDAAGNSDPLGIWSDGTTMWVADGSTPKLFAYRMSDGSRDSGKDFTMLHSNSAFLQGIWSDGTTMWVVDGNDNTLYAYRMSDKGRDSGKDITPDDPNIFHSGIWSDGTTMWVADAFDPKLYAYTLSNGNRDSGKDFTLDAGMLGPFGIWSDHTTTWVVETIDPKIYAYHMSDKSRAPGKDFNTLHAALNTDPTGIWSDETTMWVADIVDNKLKAYQMPPPNTPAVGAPVIAGIPAVAHELTADVTGIIDADGLTNVSYSYQWIRVDGGTETNIGTDSSTYTLVDDDAGKNIKVTVSFTDDGGNRESLTSQEVGPVVAVDPTPGVMVRNTGQGIYSSTVQLNSQREAWTQRFETGSDASFYKVDSIGIRFATIHDSSNPASELTVTLHGTRTFSTNTPNDEILCTLTNPATFTSNAVNTFHAPTSGDFCPLLNPEETYAVVVKRANANTHEISLSLTETRDSDILNPPTGWTIVGIIHYFPDSTGRWDWILTRPLMMEVKGESLVSKSTSAIPALTAESVGWNIARFDVTVASPGTVFMRWRPGGETNFSEGPFTVEPDENNEAALVLGGFTRGVAYVVQASQDASFSDPAEVAFRHEYETLIRDIQVTEVGFTTAVVEITRVPVGYEDRNSWVLWNTPDALLPWQNQQEAVPAGTSVVTHVLSPLAMGTTYIVEGWDGFTSFNRFPRESFTTLSPATLSPTSLTIPGGGSRTYTIVLDTAPTANVTIDISAAGDVTTDLTSVTFTPSNWNEPQTVTVSAAEDADDVDDFETITHTVASGSAAEFANANIPEMPVWVPEIGAILSPTSLTIDEGGSDTYTVVLSTEPTANVTISITAGGDVTARPNRLVFTPSNWDTERTVTLTAAQDIDGYDDTQAITHAATSSDQDYHQVSIPDVQVTVRDDETPPPKLRDFIRPGISLNPGAAGYGIRSWASRDAIAVAWWAERDAAEYRLEYREGGTTGAWTRITRGDFDRRPSSSSNRMLMGVATGLDCETSYDFRISIRGDGRQYANAFGPYTEGSFMSGSCGLPDRPSNLLRTITPDCAILTWTAPTAGNYTGVRIRRFVSGIAGFTTIYERLNVAPTTYRDCRNSGDDYGDHDGYNYWIDYIKSDGAGGIVESENAKTGNHIYGPSGDPLLQAPRNLRLTEDTDARRRMSWQAPPSWDLNIVAGLQGRSVPERDPWITGYEVERREFVVLGDDPDNPENYYFTEDEGWVVVRQGNDGNLSTSFTDNERANGRKFVYRIMTTNSLGRSSRLFIYDWLWDSPHRDAVVYLAATDNTGDGGNGNTGGDQTNSPATGAPGISGTAQAGETLTATTSGIADADGLSNVSYGYQWVAGDADIQDATGSTYEVSDGDVGKTIKVRVSFTDDAGNQESLTSMATDPVAARPQPLNGFTVVDASDQTVLGTLSQGATLALDDPDGGTYGIRADTGAGALIGSVGLELSGAMTVSRTENDAPYSLYGASGVALNGGSLPTGSYTLRATAYAEDNLDGGVLGTLEVSFTVAQANRPATGAPAINGTAQAGQTLTADITAIADPDGLTNVAYSYQWIGNDANGDTDIADATGTAYELTGDDVGKTVKVRVSFTDDAGNEESLTSAATAAVAAGPLTAAFPASQFQSARHQGADDRPLVIVTFNRPVSSIEKTTPSVSLTGATVYASASYQEKGLENAWLFMLDPEGEGEVRFNLLTGRPCDDGGICAADGTTLSAAPGTRIIPGPGGAVQNSPATGLPTISGMARVGETLTAGTSGIADEDGLTNVSYRYQWLAGGSDIDGATGSSHTLTSGEQSQTIRVRVSFTDDAGNAESLTSAPTDAVAARPNSPATGRPAISGTAQAGYTLTASTGDIADADGLTNVSYTYQWLADDADIQDATASTYAVSNDDVGKTIRVRVSFADDAGNAESLSSAATATVTAPPLTVALEQNPTSHDGSSEFTFEIRFSEHIPDLSFVTLKEHAFTETGGTVENAKRLDPDSDTPNVLWRITVQPNGNGDVTIVLPVTTDCNAQGAICTEDDRALSNRLELTVIGPDSADPNTPATGAPTITGTAQVGETLTAVTSGIADLDGLDNAAFSYQWTRNYGNAGRDIEDATGSTYQVSSGDVGKTIKVRVSFTDDRGTNETLTSAATAAVTARPNTPATGAPTITGTAQVGETLTAGITAIADADGLTNVSYTYQWLADDADIDGATGSTYELTDDDLGKSIKVRVAFTDDAGNAESLSSAATATVTAPPLTVALEQNPTSHDGSSEFTFEIRFSEHIADLSYVTLKEHAFTETGGTVENAKRLDPDSATRNIHWRITVQPNGNGDVTIVLPVTTDCNAQGAICTEDDRALSNRLELTVPGPDG